MIRNDEARESIIGSIRSNLAVSKPYDRPNPNPDASVPLSRQAPSSTAAAEVVQVFKRNVEAVDGRCFVVESEAEGAEVVKRIVQGRRIANPNGRREDLFKSDVGVTRAQAAIAETGTLVLDSSVERNRLVSLVPPIHIAILNASQIYPKLTEVLTVLHTARELSSTITFITGPSRTADIELTLAIGVHGPQELYVIVVQNN
jgi:L-lactate utilization protein LutC